MKHVAWLRAAVDSACSGRWNRRPTNRKFSIKINNRPIARRQWGTLFPSGMPQGCPPAAALKHEGPMVWLRVKSITSGLFPSECAVELSTTDGDLQLFVSRQQINEKANALKVIVLDQDETYALVQVPSQGGGSVAKINKADVLSPEGSSTPARWAQFGLAAVDRGQDIWPEDEVTT